ncbi:hypothetical protein AYO21_08294 [Fonsecaea monophora]|uniref:DUF6594 domain-containing protein n=1 Tax=Fonsecaea monophora TaxID=254056 RepID=A0A177F1R0_9EURO|nr:hypothetical protein AYO21_08294 [Fonsecaea monophora]KAH0843904.1 hypothetical protein FOPE_08945 [Fonsecaea pedrosoi]OAG37440.1 hypothetical protein AYO21_08294 [Fonsecaea monophora]
MAGMRGYDKLAHLMSHYPEYGIVRRFRELNYRNILYLQAELVQLEAELQSATTADAQSRDPLRQHYGNHFPLLSASLGAGHDVQWTTMLEIRSKLEKYSEPNVTLPLHAPKSIHFPGVDQKALGELGRPAKHNLTFLRSWFERRHMGNRPIISSDRHVWDVEKEHDLVVLEPAGFADALSDWISGHCVPLYHRTIGKHHKATVDWDPASEMSWYSSSGIQAAVDVVATIISCLFPVGATVVLYFVQSMGARLGALAAFTAVFAFCLALLTNAKRVEIFAATTAFAAVQVVFIGTNSANPGGYG